MRFSILLVCLSLILPLVACGIGDTLQRGGAAVSEGAERGWRGFGYCQEERDKRRLGLKYDPNACPPVPSNPEGRV